MGFIKIHGGGGSIDLDFLTANADDILGGKIGASIEGEPIIGTLSLTGNASNNHVLSGFTFYNTNAKAKQTGSLTVQSVINFNVAQYSSSTVICTWALPNKGPWSGLRIMCKQGSYPANVSDGTLFYEGSATSATKALAVGTWYFRAWNYMTTSNGRIYGSYIDKTVNNKQIKGQQTFTSSGIFTVPAQVYSIDVFCVGGGGGGGTTDGSWKRNDFYYGGGGGGYTVSQKINVTPYQQINVNIGMGGTPGSKGGNTTFGSVAANGGNPGYTVSSGGTYARYYSHGGNGGSGGGGYRGNILGGEKSGGSDGSDGLSDSNTKPNHVGGTGQHTTTRAFAESSGTLYSGGGGGVQMSTGNSYPSGGIGGNGGGGNGANVKQTSNPINATPGTSNTGGGGGGGGYKEGSDNYSPAWAPGASGGSGICLIRWGY